MSELVFVKLSELDAVTAIDFQNSIIEVVENGVNKKLNLSLLKAGIELSSALLTKLNGIATGATKNDTDANLKNRANHTGTQAITTISGLESALSAKASSQDLTNAIGGLESALSAKASSQDLTNAINTATQNFTTAINAATNPSEKSWTPTLIGETGSGVADVAVGSRALIGETMHLSGRVSVSDVGTITGALKIGGLPVVSSNIENMEWAGAVGKVTGVEGNVSIYLAANSQEITILKDGEPLLVDSVTAPFEIVFSIFYKV